MYGESEISQKPPHTRFSPSFFLLRVCIGWVELYDIQQGTVMSYNHKHVLISVELGHLFQCLLRFHEVLEKMLAFLDPIKWLCG